MISRNPEVEKLKNQVARLRKDLNKIQQFNSRDFNEIVDGVKALEEKLNSNYTSNLLNNKATQESINKLSLALNPFIVRSNLNLDQDNKNITNNIPSEKFEENKNKFVGEINEIKRNMERIKLPENDADNALNARANWWLTYENNLARYLDIIKNAEDSFPNIDTKSAREVLDNHYRLVKEMVNNSLGEPYLKEKVQLQFNNGLELLDNTSGLIASYNPPLNNILNQINTDMDDPLKFKEALETFDNLVSDEKNAYHLKNEAVQNLVRKVNTKVITQISAGLTDQAHEAYSTIKDDIENQAKVENLGSIAERLGNYVTENILERPSLDGQKWRYERWINIADNLHNNGDYFDAQTIVSKLTMGSFAKLQDLYSISSDAKQKFTALQEVYSNKSGVTYENQFFEFVKSRKEENKDAIAPFSIVTGITDKIKETDKSLLKSESRRLLTELYVPQSKSKSNLVVESNLYDEDSISSKQTALERQIREKSLDGENAVKEYEKLPDDLIDIPREENYKKNDIKALEKISDSLDALNKKNPNTKKIEKDINNNLKAIKNQELKLEVEKEVDNVKRIIERKKSSTYELPPLRQEAEKYLKQEQEKVEKYLNAFSKNKSLLAEIPELSKPILSVSNSEKTINNSPDFESEKYVATEEGDFESKPGDLRQEIRIESDIIEEESEETDDQPIIQNTSGQSKSTNATSTLNLFKTLNQNQKNESLKVKPKVDLFKLLEIQKITAETSNDQIFKIIYENRLNKNENNKPDKEFLKRVMDHLMKIDRPLNEVVLELSPNNVKQFLQSNTMMSQLQPLERRDLAIARHEIYLTLSKESKLSNTAEFDNIIKAIDVENQRKLQEVQIKKDVELKAKIEMGKQLDKMLETQNKIKQELNKSEELNIRLEQAKKTSAELDKKLESLHNNRDRKPQLQTQAQTQTQTTIQAQTQTQTTIQAQTQTREKLLSSLNDKLNKAMSEFQNLQKKYPDDAIIKDQKIKLDKLNEHLISLNNKSRLPNEQAIESAKRVIDSTVNKAKQQVEQLNQKEPLFRRK